nr:uncharacterized protein LOC108062789 [Drosophila takahashii]
MTTAASLPRVPEGLRDLMKVYTKEVLREKPADLYGFSANFFNVIVGEKSQKMVRKYEPVQTYETIMKNRVRQQVPLSLVFNIIPETLTDLIKQFIKAVLREKPENIYIFAQEYFQRMSKEKEKSGRIEYTKYSTYEKSLKDKENVTPGSKVTCECGRILSGKAKDVENRYTDTKLAEADQRTFSSRITYLQSVVIIQRQIRRFLKERKIVRDKDKCNSVEYVAAILLIQRQVRRFLAKKRVEKLKNSRDVREAKGKFNTGDYMKAVVVIQRHYRIYLKKKQERNRLKSDPVSLATAAIIIQRAFRRMVARHRAKRNASSAADQAEELNDNASETGSYTSVSTALLSTESTELGMATYEERVHQKIIHEDEEVENKNVDAGLEKEYSAETIKGQEKSMNLRKSEILSGALIENMIRKPSLENIKDFHNESKDLGEEMDIEVDEKKTSQDLEPEIKSNKSSLELETVAKAELKTKKDNEELESEFSTKNASLDVESSTQDEPKTEHTSEDIEPKNDDKVKTENFGTKSIKEENGDSEFQNIIEKRESDDGKEHDEDVQNDEKEDANILDNDKIIKSKNELTETSIKKEVTPMVSIEIEHVDDLLEDSIPTHHDSNAKDSTNGDSTAQESKYMSNVEIYSLTTVLVNHNREIREQESPVEPLDDKNLEISADTLVQTQTEENHSSVEDENETTPKSREKRSIEDKEMVQSNLENQESLITEDISLTNESNANLKPINHDEIQKGNEQKLKVDGSLDTIPAMEDISKTQSDTKGEIRSTSSEEKIIKEASIPEITSDKDPKIEDPITEDKEMIKTSISVTKDEPLDPNITNIAEKSDLPKLQMKSESIDDLELNKRDSELIIHAGTDPLKENGENSMEILHHANEKVPTDDATEETDSILKLLQQDTIPIRSESLMTEEMVPSEGEVPNDDSHNFDVFTEGIDLKNKKNVSSPSNSKEFSDEQPIKDINDSMGESIVQEQHLLVEDPSGTSVEREFEGVDAQSDTKEENKTNATELQQNIETSIEDAVTDDYDSESITKTATSKSTEVESEESVDHTKLESDLEKDIKDEGHTGAHLERDSSEHPTKTSATDTLHLEQKEDSTDFGSTSAVVEDKDNAESTPKSDSPVPLNTEQKNSSLLVSNQLIGTQNLPTNHIEIEKNTKKLSNPIVKDKDIGTLTSGRLVPTPIAELQLKSFKTPNDDGAWYDIYVEPKVASDKDLESIPTSVQSKKSDTDEQTAEVVEEPIIIAERVPSYYTPKEIIEPTIPKAKNSVSFFVSFDSDDGNPKYKIPKKFRDQSKTDNNKKAVNNEDIPSESDVDSNEEEIEVIEVSEGDPEYQQTGGSKLQTILELDNESEQPTEFSNQRTALELNGPVDTVEDNREETKSTKSNSEKFEAAYKTDILTITRSVLIIERAYRQFMSRHSLKSETNKESNFTKQNQAAKIIQKWLRNSLRIKSIKVSSDISQKSKESSAAKKIQRAYRKYVEKSKEIKSANGLLPQERTKEEKMAALVIQKAFREYSQRKYDNLNKIQSSDDTELEQNKAAQKIQRAYRRYLKLSDKSEPQEVENPVQGNSSLTYSSKLTDKPEEIDDLMTKELKALTQSSISIDTLKSTINPEILNDLKTDELQNAEPVEETVSNPIQISILADEPKRIKELKSDEFQELENLSKVSSSPIHLSKSLDEYELEMINDVEKGGEANTTSVQDKTEIIEHKDELITNHPLKDQLERKFSAALIIQRAFRQYMERKKLENFDESSLDSITSSRITAIETSNYPTAGTTPSESLVPEAAEDPGEDASKIQPKSEWFVGSTRIIPSQEVVEKPLGVATDPDPDAITSKTELDTSTQVESVETVDRTHGSLESKLTPGISSSKIDESLGVQSEKDNAVSSGLAGLTEAAEEGLDSVEDPLLLSQSDFGGIVQSLDIVSTQELVNNFLENEIEYSSKQGPFPSASLLEEVVEEPCIKKSASLVNLSEGESEPDVASQKAENTDSSVSETIGLDTLSADTIDKATVKLSKPEEVIEKMSQFRDSKSHERLPSADPSFDEPVVRPMSLLQEQSSMDIEDGDIIVYNRLQRDETRESSAQSDSVVFGEAESENIQDKDLLNEEESGRVHLIRHYTIAGDDPRGLFRSVTIDDALNYGEMGKNNQGINNTNSFCLDDETSENIRKKMMAYSLSETDSDYFDPRKSSKEDFDIDTAMADAMGTSTETESTIVSAATKIQAGARGFLTRRRLRRASAGTKSSTLDTKASFGNDAISESLERFIEEEAAKKIQAAYRMHTRKRRSHNRKMEGISLESNLAARRQKLQRGDALRNDSTPDDENSVISSEGKAQKSSKPQKKKTVGETKSKADMELKWLKMRQNSMPVQIDCEVFRVIPKHMRKRIKSAEANKRK